MTTNTRGFFRRFRLLALVLLLAPLAACNHDECSECDDDSECDDGYTCASFEQGYKFCADDDTESCSVTY